MQGTTLSLVLYLPLPCFSDCVLLPALKAAQLTYGESPLTVLSMQGWSVILGSPGCNEVTTPRDFRESQPRAIL